MNPISPLSLWRRALLTLAALLGALLTGPIHSAESPRKVFDIPAGEALVALKQFVSQSGAQLLYSVEEVAGVRTAAAQGAYTPVEAIERMLAGTKLAATHDGQSGAITVRTRAPREPNPRPTSAAPGALGVTVNNVATRKFLEGVRVELLDAGQEALTDVFGRAEFTAVPAGRQRVRVSYIGLDDETREVAIAPGERAMAAFELATAIYKLAQFVVTGEREGSAAALTRQRNAPNVKNVVAMDALGYLANENPGELLIRLPGITSNTSDEGDVFSINIRGIDPNLNSVTIDGAKMATSGGLLPLFRFLNINAAFFEELEVTKAPTPNMAADSLGGAVNMKTKSALSMKEQRVFTYRLGGKWAPSFFDYTPRRRDTPVGPLASFGYQERFNVLGGDRNLGVSVDLFHTENITNYPKTTLDWQFTTQQPAYTYQYTTLDIYNVRNQDAINARIDYQLTPTTRLYVGGMITNALEFLPPDKASLQTAATAPRSLAVIGANGQPTGTGAILPGFTDTFTSVRAVTGSTFILTQGPIGFIDKEARVQAGLEQTWRDWKFELDASHSRSRVRLDAGKTDDYEYASRRIQTTINAPIGWTLDQSASSEFPRFTQTAGPDITDIRNYNAGTTLQRNGQRKADNYSVSINARRKVEWRKPVTISAGALWQEQARGESGGNQQWTYAGPDGVIGRNAATGLNDDDLSRFADPSLKRDPRFGLGAVPTFDLVKISKSMNEERRQWIEDVYLRESAALLGTRKVREEIMAAYVMGQARLGRLGVLTGVRVEQTEVASKGWVRPQTFATIADPFARVRAEFGSAPRELKGSYRDTFPGLHLNYAITRGLQARASWSTSIGRPPGASLIPLETPNFTNRTVAVNNPALKPQHADNYDLSLEYYFEPVGLLSAGAFRKEISDFQFTDSGRIIGGGADNGFAGQYQDFTLITQGNGGAARVDGLELAYQQQLSFLPGPLKGLSVSANYTWLRTAGDYGGTSNRSTTEVAGFIPRSANARVSYARGRLKAFLSANHTGEYLIAYSADPSRLLIKLKRTTWGAGVSWRVHRRIDAFVDVNNLFDEPQLWYRGIAAHRQGTVYNGPNVNFGVSGRF